MSGFSPLARGILPATCILVERLVDRAVSSVGPGAPRPLPLLRTDTTNGDESVDEAETWVQRRRWQNFLQLARHAAETTDDADRIRD